VKAPGSAPRYPVPTRSKRTLVDPPKQEQEAPLPPGQRHFLEPLLERLRQAAGELNPYLVALVIGLAVLDLTCLVMLAPHWALTRCVSDNPLVPNAAGGVLTPAVDAALRSGT
jgi:hypothetical protein